MMMSSERMGVHDRWVGRVTASADISPLSLRSVLADCSRLRLRAVAQEERSRSAVLQDYV
ncbi:hypothetical protein N9485_03665 [Luminiphilus sp.]|nr:hypothetical protein [Luminiphilus sp.]MDA8985832.1 hypothetical protein [Luminiphilus sp.]MDB4049288.1 hypothetical protein [Luminiphilus sp.]